MLVEKPDTGDVKACFELEQALTPDAPDATKNGFFLPGVAFSTYEDLSANGYMRVIKNDAKPVSFLLAVTPGHAIITRLFENPGMQCTHATDPANTVWIAKIATDLAHRRTKTAAALYQAMFEDFTGRDFLTATALEPLRNHASENFHKAMGFDEAGRFTSNGRVNTLWLKRPG